MKRFFVLYVLLLLSAFCFAQEEIPIVKNDSVTRRSFNINSTLSASYIGQRNWDENNSSAISFLGSVDLRHRLTRLSGWTHTHNFRSEISYLKYNDSTWIKNSDYARLQLQWIEPGKSKINHSYSIYFSTQWLNSFKPVLTESGYRKEWSGGIFNPASLEFAYGFNKSFFQNSSLNIAFASVRINTLPRKRNAPDETMEKDKNIFLTKNSYVRTLYGFSAQLDVFEDLYKDVVVMENNSRLFFNALNRTSINFDFSNRIAIRFIKYLQLRFDTQLVYNPDYSGKLQYRQEILLGVFYDHRNTK